jgi:secreted trypsin-like serine protease
VIIRITVFVNNSSFFHLVRNSVFCGGPDRLDSGQICAGDAADTADQIKDSCNGDSGGPLQVSMGGSYYVFGVVRYESLLFKIKEFEMYRII